MNSLVKLFQEKLVLYTIRTYVFGNHFNFLRKMFEIYIYKGKEILLTVGDGSKIPAFVHRLSVFFANKHFLADISFSPSLGIGANILGLRSFFDNFRICFNNKKKVVEITPF